jgi:TetR/AcrR family transcriptional regulator, cholesterol catabolism regulator
MAPGAGVVTAPADGAPPAPLRAAPPTTSPPASRLSTRQAARRQRLLDTALALLEARDYERISVREVAESAGVALATLYHYFPSKEHLFAEALVQWASTLGPDVARRPLTGATSAERVEGALLRAARAFERRPQLARLLMRFETSDEPFAHEVLVRLEAATSDVYLDLLDDLPRDEAQLVVKVLDSVFDSSLRAWSSGRASTADLRRTISDAVGLLLGRPALDGANPRAGTR